MWSTVEIFQFICLNIAASFFIYFNLLNVLKRGENKIFWGFYIGFLVFNCIWFLGIYFIDFVIWKYSWGTFAWIRYGFLTISVLQLTICLIFDKNAQKNFGFQLKT
ncbi:hypothetical protein SCLARK_00888 [Spiroplasma clarkii]|uniref:Uncharacterized protein n=1 Tax=Spiroplasma clarkii TaxID=2139 RepID=A0A1Y0L1D6_9MOLU|nr:hypothetical protein [Spiroplasma clarkii]ARU91499.1 hypothetical protein SCLARK_00888 [Spiroplasma clarkii]ATX70914.1 hypothetical protein SCLAR_v1c05950 [Spiroplasma clarkii]